MDVGVARSRRGLRTRRVANLALWTVLSIGVPSGLAAQGSPQGPEFQLNSYTTNNQVWPDVAIEASGDFVAVWASDGSDGGDTSNGSIQAQRFRADGSPVGAQIQINSYTTSSQAFPKVAVGLDGKFVVTWMSAGSDGSDQDGGAVQMRIFEADGSPASQELQVNTFTTGFQSMPEVAIAESGEFVIAWVSDGSYGDDSSGYSVQARLFTPAGQPISAEFQVNDFTTGNQGFPGVSWSQDGEFVVVWDSDGSFGTDIDGPSIQARRFGSFGVPISGAFQVNTYTPDLQIGPRVAADSTGGFVVVWSSLGSPESDQSGDSVQARRFDAQDVPHGEQFQVNTYTTFGQMAAAIAVQPNGGFQVAWMSEGSSGSDTSSTSLHARQFRADGTPVDADFQVNTYTTGQQNGASIASDGSGNFIIAWHSPGSLETDSSGLSVQARRFDDLFRDGFESGDRGRWSLSVP